MAGESRSTEQTLSTEQTPLWLAHHHEDAYDRCVLVGKRHVCRRCLVLYPTAFVVMLVTLFAWSPPDSTASLMMWLLPIPVVVEWVGEHLFKWRYVALRQALLSILAAPALGVALGIHAEEPFALAAVAPMAAFGAICLASALLGEVADRHAKGVERVWEETFEASEARRTERLHAMLGEHTD